MSDLIQKILLEVCLDDRIPDGIFRLDETQHMDVLRDYFVDHGLTLEDAVAVTNRMLEGRFPERQAYNKDGILVTFPTPKHKAEAIKRGTHYDEDVAIQKGIIKKENPPEETPPSEPSSDVQRPESDPSSESPAEEPQSQGPDPDLFQPDIDDGDDAGHKLSVEPPKGDNDSVYSGPSIDATSTSPKTPQEVEAHKAVVQQMMDTDETAITSKFYPEISESDEGRQQLDEVYKFAQEKQFTKIVEFIDRIRKL